MFAKNVPFEEFARRRQVCQAKASERGLKGIFVCSRGGGSFDRFAGADYFANHYQQRCYLPDSPPLWNGRSHSLLLIPDKGVSVLVVSTSEYRDDLVAIDDVRYGSDFFMLVANAAAELDMDSGKVGLIYEDVLTHRMAKELFTRMPNLELIPCDDILEEMRIRKTPREIESIRHSCRIGSEAVDIIMNGVSPGMRESEVLGPAMEHVFSEGAVLYFVVTNSGKNGIPVHSIDFPGYDSQRIMQKGDLFKVDLIILYEGYICDFGRSTLVGGTGSSEHRKMIELTANSCQFIIDAVKPGMAVRELCLIGDEYLMEQGVSFSEEQNDSGQIYAAYPPHWGHGIGMTWERPWFIEEEMIVIGVDNYLAIEKGLYQPGWGTVTFEQNILVTEDSAEILTTPKKIWL